MAKAPIKKAAGKKVKVAKTGIEDLPGNITTDEKPAKKKRRKTLEPQNAVVMHGETRITHGLGEDDAKAVQPIGRLIEEIHAKGRVLVTSAAHFGNRTTMHIVLPDHPQTYDSHPGLILEIDAVTNQVSFDHVVVGRVTADLMDDAAYTILTTMRGEDPAARNAIGKIEDWFSQSVSAAEDVADRHAD